MALTDSTKTSIGFKKVIGKDHRISTKQWYEEPDGGGVNVVASSVWADPIPSTPPLATTAVVKVYKDGADGALKLTYDNAVTLNRGWYAAGPGGTRLRGWIPSKFGQGYTVKLYQDNGSGTGKGSQIYTTDPMNWFFDYETGYLSIQDAHTYRTPFWIEAYHYVGQTVDEKLGLGSLTITNDTTTNAEVFPTWVGASSGSQPIYVTDPRMTFNPSTGILSTNLKAFVDIDRCGFIDHTTSSISFDPDTYMFTLTDTSGGTGWTYYRAGIRCTVVGNKTATLPGTPPDASVYYIFIDADDGTLSVSVPPWSLTDTKVPVAIIFFNDALTPKYHMGDERHTCAIDRGIHKYLHFTRGTQFVSGGILTGYSPIGSTDPENTFQISETVIADEDLTITLSQLPDPPGDTLAYTIYYRTAPGVWEWTSSETPFIYAPGGFIEYDSNGVLTQPADMSFVNTYLLYTNQIGDARFVIIPGRNEYPSLITAQMEDPGTFSWTGLPLNEVIIGYKITWAVNSALSTKGMCQLAAEPILMNSGLNSHTPYDPDPWKDILVPPLGIYYDAGYVGIGKNSPQYVLDVYQGQSLSALIQIDGENDSLERGFQIAQGGNPQWEYYSYQNENSEFIYQYNYISDRDLTVLSSDGRFAINKTSNEMNYHNLAVGGPDDMVVSGLYTREIVGFYQVRVTYAGTPDKFSWRFSGDQVDWTPWSADQDMTPTPYELAYGVSIVFENTTGHSIGNFYQFSAYPQLPFAAFSITATGFDEIQYRAPGGATWVDLTYIAQNLSIPPFFAPIVTEDMGPPNYLYFAKAVKFNTINIAVEQFLVGTNVVLQAEYWNGSAWAPMTFEQNTFIDGTEALSSSGNISWDKSSIVDWTTENASGPEFADYTEPYYWVRVHAVSGVVTVQPKIYLLTAAPHYYIASYAAQFDSIPSFAVSGLGRAIFGLPVLSFSKTPKVVIEQEAEGRAGLYIHGNVNHPGSLATFADNSTANSAIVESDGSLLFTGTARKYKVVHKNARDFFGYLVTMNSISYAPADMGIVSGIFPAYVLTKGSAFMIPWVVPGDAVDSEDIKVTIFYTISASQVGAAVASLNIGETHAASGGGYSSTVNFHQNITPSVGGSLPADQVISSNFVITGTGITGHSSVNIIIGRDSSGSDTFNNDLLITDVQIEYLSDRLGE